MEKSILKTVKKALMVPEDYDVFDTDLVMYINTAFATLSQLGVGPDDGYEIADDTAEWSNIIGDNKKLNLVQNWLCQKVKLSFDPPGTSFHLAAVQETVKELEWRLNVERESIDWVDPAPAPPPFHGSV